MTAHSAWIHGSRVVRTSREVAARSRSQAVSTCSSRSSVSLVPSAAVAVRHGCGTDSRLLPGEDAQAHKELGS